MAIGPLAGGMIRDAFSDYHWLYLGAWMLGIGACLISMTFRPFPKAEPSLAAAE
jgi:hypothetical protein